MGVRREVLRFKQMAGTQGLIGRLLYSSGMHLLEEGLIHPKITLQRVGRRRTATQES